MLALYELRESLAESERLRMWSAELEVQVEDMADRCHQAGATDPHQKTHV